MSTRQLEKNEVLKKSMSCIYLWIILMTVLVSGCKKEVLMYGNNFQDPSSIEDWVLEGPGKIEWQKGKMILIPDAEQAINEKWEQCGRRILDRNTEFNPVIQNVIKKTNPEIASQLVDTNGIFDGGHIVCWNKAFKTGNSYIVEYDFKPLSPVGLGLIFFSATGVHGEDVLSDKLTPRYGAFKQYVKGEISCYHISYWSNNAHFGKRGTCNLRKNPGAYCLANGYDPSVKDLFYNDNEFAFKTHKMRLIKQGHRIRYYIDGHLVIDFTDKEINDVRNEEGIAVVWRNVDTGKVLGAGRIGLRNMVELKAEYSNFKVYNICD